VACTARESAQPPDPDGRIQVIPIESVDHAAGTRQHLGADAEVLAQTGLRQRIIDIVTMLAATYRR
jgi:hypothetical protein